MFPQNGIFICFYSPKTTTSNKLEFIGELTATQKLTMTTISVGTGVLDGPETMGVDVLYGDVKTF